MVLQPNQPSIRDIRSHGESRHDTVYSNISEDSIDSETPPSVPPRTIGDTIPNSKFDNKKSIINYPAITPYLNNNNSTSVKSNDSQKKEVHKFGESSSSIYSEMSLSSSSNHNEEIYSGSKESETTNNTLPFMRKNQHNLKTNPPNKEFNFLLNQTEESPKIQSASNLTNKFKVVSIGNNDIYSYPSEEVNHEAIDNDNDNDNVDDVYMIPRETVRPATIHHGSPPSSTDDTYCNPNDDEPEMVSPVPDHDSGDTIIGGMFSLWPRSDVERALRVAKDDTALAREILMEFGAKL